LKLIRRLEDFPAGLRGGALTIGNFDGVHRGHREIIRRLKAAASRVAGPAVVFTFDPHPALLLRPREAPPPLTWIDRKAELLAELGVDAVLACPTTEALLQLSWQDFFDRIIREGLGAAAVVEGSNFRFGHNRGGDVASLAARCHAAGMAFESVAVLEQSAATVSSSRIRELIRTGGVGAARQLLTQPYRIRGLVVHGAARGAKLGFPTANLHGIDTLVPAAGVYAGRALWNGQSWGAAIHVGPIPTFGDGTTRVEAHLLDFGGSLYGQLVELDFLERLREILHFTNSDELCRQMELDIADCRAVWQTFSAGTTRIEAGKLTQ
jgi:riboflavin kinase / FMN adenylyltransferase